MINKNHQYSNVVVTGSVAFDEIMDFPNEFKDYFDPNKLHQINISFVVDRLEKQIGGTGTNIVHNLRILLSKKFGVKLLAAVGKDGQQFVKWLKKRNIETKGLLVDENLYTASGKAITDKKDNQIWGFYYGALVKGRNINLLNHINKNSLFILSATHPEVFLNFQKQAIKNNVDYLYDPGMAITWIKQEDLKIGVENCKWLVGNDYEIGRITKILNTDIVSLSRKGKKIITTLGEQGVHYFDKDNNITVKAYKVKKSVDPTGAGDAWRAGFVSGLVTGKNILESLKIGNAIASFAVEEYGTVNHLPSEKEVIKRANSLNTI